MVEPSLVVNGFCCSRLRISMPGGNHRNCRRSMPAFGVVGNLPAPNLTPMLIRKVIPELLDHLPADDPDAQRSRRDLRRINFLMGNERWVCRTLRRFPEAAGRGIIEIGAGDGKLCGKIARRFPQAPVAAYDLAPVPAELEPQVAWHRGDIFTMPPPPPGGVRIANLFLHHFEGESLAALGRWLGNADVLIFNEPDRATTAPPARRADASMDQLRHPPRHARQHHRRIRRRGNPAPARTGSRRLALPGNFHMARGQTRDRLAALNREITIAGGGLGGLVARLRPAAARGAGDRSRSGNLSAPPGLWGIHLRRDSAKPSRHWGSPTCSTTPASTGRSPGMNPDA